MRKSALTYFITILYDKETLDTLVMSIVCMPNGELESHYKGRVLSAGKNIEITRFNFSKITKFELLDPPERRIRVVYFKDDMDEHFKRQLTYFQEMYENPER